MSATYKFIPWVRQGAATAIQKKDTLDANIPGRAVFPVTMQLNNRSDTEVRVPVSLYGPGAVTGIDGHQIVRTDPPPLTLDFEANYFPSIDFDMPDFPWLFTPAAGDAQGRLRPWICLVVVRKQHGVSISVSPRKPLPVLRIQAPAIPEEELPDLADSWAWAHTQIASSRKDQSIRELLDSDSPQNVSRLMCPRRLEPRQQYYACVVPAFQAGRKSGLGLALTLEDEQQLRPAWSLDNNASPLIELPVYYHWEFGTDIAGDFESLVRLLEARPLSDRVGVRDMVVKNLPFQLPDMGVMGLEGALRHTNFESTTPKEMQIFQQTLQEIVNLPEAQSKKTNTDPIVAPPIYGRWQTLHTSIAKDGVAPHWLRELNLDPRFRAIAGLGTMVVQDQQEQLMASAWEQLGDRQANRILRQSQMAREVGKIIHEKRFSKMSLDLLFQMTAPIHARIRMSPETFHQKIRQRNFPHRLFSASFRRIVRPTGPVVRQMLPTVGRQSIPFVNVRTAKTVARPKVKVLPIGPIPPFVAKRPRPRPGKKINPVIARMNTATQDFQQYLAGVTKLGVGPTRPNLTAKEINTFHAILLKRIDPDQTIPQPLENRIVRTEGTAPLSQDPFEPLTTAPQFPQPMYETLRDISQELLLPGLEHIPPNSVSLLETNPRFIEAFMVGLNHEMSRELLWREFPTDQRETYFKKFWEDRGNMTVPHSEQMEPIHLWNSDNHLGDNFQSGSSKGHLVLLIRGDLLRRYPTASIHMIKAERNEKGQRVLSQQEEHYPLFQGWLKPDITFFGFPLTAEEALGDVDEQGKPSETGAPGWFFMIQQQPTEPRFGLDVATKKTFGEKPKKWNDASWGHLAKNEAALKQLNHVTIGGPLKGHSIKNISWGFNQAHMAMITLQRPVRIGIHASTILP